MLKILHVVPTYLPATRYGGPIYSVHGLCRGLVEAGHEVHVCTTSVDGDRNSNVPLDRPVLMDGVHVWYFTCRYARRLYWSPSMYRHLEKVMAEFDVVHLHSVFLWPTWAAARLARKNNVPYVLAPRGMLVKDLIRRKSTLVKSAWIYLIERRNIEGACFIHATAEIERSEFEKFHFDQPDVRLIPNGVEMPTPYVAQEVSEDIRELIACGPYLLFLGRLNWKKGLDRLMDAMSGIDSHCLLIVGNDEEGYLGTLESLVMRKGLQSRVRILPRFVEGADKEALIEGADLFVLPSYSENFGNTVVEAMVRACPVVVTSDVGAAEIVEAAGGGLVVDGGDLDRIMPRVLSDVNWLRQAGGSARAWVEKNLSWRCVAAAMIEEYERIQCSRHERN